jgi:hypothetical protein
MEEITAIVKKEDYMEKRSQLQQEMNSLRPIDYDELTEAADLLTHFNTYWNKCADLPQPEIARQQLITKIVERIFVYNQRIVALVLHGDFGIVLGGNEIASATVTDAIYNNLNALGIATAERTYCGDDGVQFLLVYPGILLAPYGSSSATIERFIAA